MIALLSPAKNMDFSKVEVDVESRTPQFLQESTYLMNKLKKLSARQIGKMMHLSAELSDLNYQRYQDWNEAYDDVESKLAMFAFNGEVYRGLSCADFNEQDLDFANDHLAILSGLHGLLNPFDLIQPYRLEMGVRWPVTKTQNNLYKFWGSKISHALNKTLEDHKSKYVVNLASNEYSKVLDLKVLNAEKIDCQFLDWKNGSFRAVMTWAKNARGRMAREIIKNRAETLDDLKNISFNKYVFHEEMSDDKNLVFTR